MIDAFYPIAFLKALLGCVLVAAAVKARDPPASVVDGKELHRQLLAMLSIDDKRIRGLMIRLLKILSELDGVKVQRGT